ncbi:TPA: hypothetical protein QFR36_000563 [Enterococcus faecium]|uniref:hypothetical protein n=1 Tax=Enterococcus TaxID=1350 RepID=UPI0002A43FF1|nr:MULTISPECIES: hypothetical protein [Enterococcus]ELB19860.1 hypothetical protein OIQ_03520 [Enterococcus faecium EnGen0025]MBU9741675.1 hypothetical protein [Enterococcus faecium]MEB4618915.1 hypothetical protein [Enterococcus sp. E4-79]MEB4748909.1 hypothetical protein [Enterococcus sp. E4-163]NTL90223.1 hypothetical protein [Enterococcus faecium]
MNTSQLVRKKYVKNRIKKVFVQSNVTIPKVVINKIATALYKEFINLSIEEQERVIFSEELVACLWEKHVSTKAKELLKEI